MSELKKVLTVKEGVVLGIGSIMGSGVLFLPSLTFGLSGPHAVWGWIITTLLCLPLIFIFKDSISAVPSESGLEGWISLGLGENIGSTVPILLLGTVCIGMPSAAIIAGQYIEKFLGFGSLTILGSAASIIGISVLSNLKGVEAGSLVQKIVAFGLFGFGLAIFLMTWDIGGEVQTSLAPRKLLDGSQFSLVAVFSTVLVGFWAFAGFENMTFMAGEFRNPVRDMITSIVISLILCSALYIGLTYNFIGAIKSSEVDSITGLLSLVNKSDYSSSLGTAIVSSFAFIAVLMNFISWLWGISRMMYSSANKKILPSYLSKLSKRKIPANALLTLGAIFSSVIMLETLFPKFFDFALIAVSTNFTVLYLLAVAAFIIYSKSKIKKVLGIGVAIPLIFAVLTSGWIILYPSLLISAAYFVNRKKLGRSKQILKPKTYEGSEVVNG